MKCRQKMVRKFATLDKLKKRIHNVIHSITANNGLTVNKTLWSIGHLHNFFKNALTQEDTIKRM